MNYNMSIYKRLNSRLLVQNTNRSELGAITLG